MDDPSPTGAKCAPQRKFMLARICANQKEVADIRTDGQHHDAECSHDHPQDASHVAGNDVVKRLQIGCNAPVGVNLFGERIAPLSHLEPKATTSSRLEL